MNDLPLLLFCALLAGLVLLGNYWRAYRLLRQLEEAERRYVQAAERRDVPAMVREQMHREELERRMP